MLTHAMGRGPFMMAVRNGAMTSTTGEETDAAARRQWNARRDQEPLEGYTQRVYFQALITSEGISRADLAKVIAAAERSFFR